MAVRRERGFDSSLSDAGVLKTLCGTEVESRVTGSHGALEDSCRGRSGRVWSQDADLNGRTRLCLRLLFFFPKISFYFQT